MRCSNCEVEKNTKDMGECVACKELFCADCLVPPKPPPHPMIDFNICDSCYNFNS